MTGDQGENDDILGFGSTDRAPRPSRLAIRLDRLTLRITRRPRLAAALAGLAIVALAAGPVAYFGPARAAAGPSAAQHAVSTQCANSNPSKAAAVAIARFLQQLQAQATSTSLAYTSTLTITSTDVPGATTSVIAVDPATGTVRCATP